MLTVVLKSGVALALTWYELVLLLMTSSSSSGGRARLLLLLQFDQLIVALIIFAETLTLVLLLVGVFG